jgi:hypothetical protein
MRREGKRDPGASAREKLFKKFKGGDDRALIDLLENERPQLYDYLMRMTGQISRSFESVSEVFQSVSEGSDKDEFDSADELRILLYTTGHLECRYGQASQSGRGNDGWGARNGRGTSFRGSDGGSTIASVSSTR